jgi:succinoglycan biosynthesis protein ExoA
MSITDSRRPLVSVIMPVYNEAAHIERVVESILGQSRRGFDLEVLAIDGSSSDGTRHKLQASAQIHPELRLLSNPRRVTPVAFNIGLAEARGEYVCIFGAHTVYDPDYISVCLEELLAQRVSGCGGRVQTTAANESLQAKLVAAALGCAFGTSRKSFRNHPEGAAATINYPVYRRQPLIDAGGYDESLHRNQDNDLNQRLRAKGHRLYMTWRTGCRYFVQPTVRKLAQYGWKTGYWNVISVKQNASAHGLYHFVPGMFVLALQLTCLLALFAAAAGAPHQLWLSSPLILLLLAYFGSATVMSFITALRSRWIAAMMLPPVFFALHVSYGAGTLWALLRNAKSPDWIPTPQQSA